MTDSCNLGFNPLSFIKAIMLVRLWISSLFGKKGGCILISHFQ